MLSALLSILHFFHTVTINMIRYPQRNVNASYWCFWWTDCVYGPSCRTPHGNCLC